MKKVMPPPPPLAATCLAFHSRDDGIVAIGMDNSTIVIYNLHSDEFPRKLEGHSKRVTSVAYSEHSECTNGKELRSLSDTYIQIHQNELHLLAINKTHLAVYEVKELACVSGEGRLPHPKVRAYQGLFEEPFGFLILHSRIKNKRHPKRDQATQ
ncbi:hypothetical protein Pyn_07433 [Prunus yedoensis var. nudiflora]|uniref:Uncharacterized protein n=1 Tax=Prunus yedoensis var. nudiflora TaxID=2094558 RepID=A0A314UCP5_PRUYE|nr:hypothetical protein Pyn_07433 [Prunus yedoensis var. nudiflora]